MDALRRRVDADAAGLMRPPGRFYRWPWKVRVDEEVDEELAFHVEMRTREYIAAGLAPEAARREAEARLGDRTRMRATLTTMGKRRDRHMQATQYIGELWQDVAFTARGFIKNPGFAAIAILTLALGIGGTTAIFSALYAVVLRPLPLRDPDGLWAVGETYRGTIAPMSAGIYVDAEAGTTAFSGLAAAQAASFNLADAGTPERVLGSKVTANYFDVMGASPVIGRAFTSAEDRPGSERVVVLSDRLWRRRFGGAPLVGRDIRLNSTPYTVVGIMPASFDFTSGTDDLWTPIAFTPERRRMHDEHFLQVYGRLKPGMTRDRAMAELDRVAKQISHDYASEVVATGVAFTMMPFRDQFVGGYRALLSVLMGAAGFVLLIACGNVANLLLARGSSRSREIAVRAAIGAARGRIVRQLLTESVVLGLAAAVAGVVLAYAALHAVVAWSPPGIPRLEQAQVDPLALGFAAFVALTSSILCGIAPALRLARGEVQGGLHEGKRGTIGGGFRDRVRGGLIAGEVALTLLLLVGAGLLIRSALAMQRVELGFDPAGVLAARFTLPEQAYPDPAQEADVLRRIGEMANAIPGVSAAAVSSFAAMGGGGGSNGLTPETSGGFDRTLNIQSTLRLTTAAFFPAMGTPILKGRSFTDDDRAGTQKVMIISAALAAAAFPGQDPIGKRISCCDATPDGGPSWKTVIGVAGDIRSRGPATRPEPEFYLPWSQAPKEAWSWFRTFYIVARTSGDPMRLAPPLREVLARIDPDVALFDVRTMDQRLKGTLATARFNTLLLSALGVVALMLAASGIYGVVSYLVSQRTQEIGVRMALGATAGSVVALVLRQSMKPVGLGAAIGVAAAAGGSRLLASQLFEARGTDLLTIVVVAATLIAVALMASAVPARRAAAIDPTRALSAD
jgi:putative ABC transport system permease protein